MSDRFAPKEYDKRVTVERYKRMIDESKGRPDQINATLAEMGKLPPRVYELGPMLNQLVSRLYTEGMESGGWGENRPWEEDLKEALSREPLAIEFQRELDREERMAAAEIPWSQVLENAPWFDSLVSAVGSLRHLPGALWQLGGELTAPWTDYETVVEDSPALRSMAEGVGEYFQKGGLKRKMLTDPVSPLSDALSAVSFGAGSALQGGLNLSNKARGGLEVTRRLADTLDPYALPSNVLSGLANRFAPGEVPEMKTDVVEAEQRLQSKGFLGKEGFPASFISDDPKIYKTEVGRFKVKNRKLFRQLQDFFKAPDKMAEGLESVTPADAGARIGQAVEVYRSHFYDTSDAMFNELGKRIRKTADRAAFTAVTGSPDKRAKGTRYTGQDVLSDEVPKDLRAIQGNFQATLNRYDELRSYEDEVIERGGKPSQELQAVQSFLDDTIPGLTTGEVSDVSMELVKQARTTLIRKIKSMREQNIDPTARSYLQSIQDTLTTDLNNSAEAYARKAGDTEFADAYSEINRYYADGKGFLNSRAGQVITEAIENPGQLDRLVDDLLFKGGLRRTQSLPTVDIPEFYQQLEKADPGIASELRSAFTIMFLNRAKNASKNRVTASNFDRVLNSLDPNKNPTSAQVRLGRIVGDDVAGDLLALKTSLEAQEGSALSTDRVGRLREGELSEVASMGFDDFLNKPKSLNSIASVIFGLSRGGLGLARSAVLALVIGQDQYQKLSDSGKRFRSGKLEPLNDVVKFIEASNLPVRFGLKGGRQVYNKERNYDAYSQEAINQLNADLSAKIEGFNQMLSGPTELGIDTRPYSSPRFSPVSIGVNGKGLFDPFERSSQQPLSTSEKNRLNLKTMRKWDSIVKEVETKAVPAALINAVILAESSGNPKVRSSAGAKGLMQLMDATAKDLGVKDSFDPKQNVRGGAEYLNWLMERFDGNLDEVLAAYNWGPTNVAKYGIESDKMPTETKEYIKKVKDLFGLYERLGVGL